MSRIPLPILLATGVLGDGAAGIEYTNASPTAITPTLGAELTTNADLSAWTGDNPDWWDTVNESGGDPEITERNSGQLHADTPTTGGAANFYASSNANILRIQKQILTSYHWYQLQATISATNSGTLFLADDATAIYKGFNTVATHTVRGRVAGTYAQFRAATGAYDLTVDSVSVKEITDHMVDERASVPIGSWGYNHWQVLPYRNAGGYLQYDATNYIYWYICRTMDRLYLDTIVNGTGTRVADAAITYSDAKAVWWRHAAADTWLIGYDTPANIEAYSEADFTTNALINVNTVNNASLNLSGNVYTFGALSSDAGNAAQKHYYHSLGGL